MIDPVDYNPMGPARGCLVGLAMAVAFWTIAGLMVWGVLG